MSASALISGRIFHAPESRTTKAGKPFVVAKLREGRGDAVVWWSVAAFAEEAREELKSLADGDAVAVSGPFSVTIYEQNGAARLNHSIVAEKVVSARRAKTPRKPAGDFLSSPEDAPPWDRDGGAE